MPVTSEQLEQIQQGQQITLKLELKEYQQLYTTIKLLDPEQPLKITVTCDHYDTVSKTALANINNPWQTENAALAAIDTLDKKTLNKPSNNLFNMSSFHPDILKTLHTAYDAYLTKYNFFMSHGNKEQAITFHNHVVEQFETLYQQLTDNQQKALQTAFYIYNPIVFAPPKDEYQAVKIFLKECGEGMKFISLPPSKTM